MSKLIKKLRPYSKAIVGSAAALAITIAKQKGVDLNAWLERGAAFLATLGLVWRVPNTPAPPEG